jgi:hypothetical protein
MVSDFLEINLPLSISISNAILFSYEKEFDDALRVLQSGS